MKQFNLWLFLLLMPLLAFSQKAENQNYSSAFKAAYEACPSIPQGWLEAISFTNTHCNHRDRTPFPEEETQHVDYVN